MMIRLRSAAAAACAAVLALTGSSALADPALWVVKGTDSTVYLFGSIHAVNPNQTWRTPAIDRAFRESAELWLEIPFPVTSKGSAQPFTPEEAQHMNQLMATLGTTVDGPPLSSRLTPSEAAQLAVYLPLPTARTDRMRPWMAASLVGATLVNKLGLSVTSAADYALDQDAIADGKPVYGFETFEQQLHFFADLSPEEELDYLRQTLADAGEGRALLEVMEREWLAGDDKALTKTAVGELHDKWPLIYRRFVVDRNKSWIPRIETMLKSSGVRFVVVGGAHLLGPDGVPALLKADGWKVVRVH